MTYEQTFCNFVQAHQICIDSAPFYALDDLYQLGMNLQEGKIYQVDICLNEEYPLIAKVTKLKQDILQEIFDLPLNQHHYFGIGYFKHLIDSTCGEDTFHPKLLFNASRYILPRKLEAAEEVMLKPFCRITDYGPNVLLERRSKVPVFRRSVHTN